MQGLNTGEGKTFWQRPEGKTGMLAVAAMAGGGAYALYKFLPFLITLLENTLYASLLAGALVLLTSPIWSTKVRTLVSYGFRSIMRGITGFFITIDPIGILKNYVEDLDKKLAKMDEQISRLKGSIQNIKSTIDKNFEGYNKEMGRAKVAKERGNTSALTVASRQAMRLENSNKKLSELLAKMENLFKTLVKLREISSTMKEDITNEVNLREEEHKAIKASHGAFKSAMAIIRGDGDAKDLYDQTLEHLANDYAMKIGEIETFMTLNEGFMASVDLDNAAFEQEALARLEQMSAGDTLFAKPGAHVVHREVEQNSPHALYR